MFRNKISWCNKYLTSVKLKSQLTLFNVKRFTYIKLFQKNLFCINAVPWDSCMG